MVDICGYTFINSVSYNVTTRYIREENLNRYKELTGSNPHWGNVWKHKIDA